MVLTRNEHDPQPLDELQQLRDENARLKALLTSHGIACKELLILPRNLQLKNQYQPQSNSAPPTRLRCSAVYLEVAPMFIRCVGSRPGEHRAIRLPAATNGSPVYATSLKSNAANARSDRYCTLTIS